jgi:hypothetical protein
LIGEGACGGRGDGWEVAGEIAGEIAAAGGWLAGGEGDRPPP